MKSIAGVALFILLVIGLFIWKTSDSSLNEISTKGVEQDVAGSPPKETTSETQTPVSSESQDARADIDPQLSTPNKSLTKESPRGQQATARSQHPPSSSTQASLQDLLRNARNVNVDVLIKSFKPINFNSPLAQKLVGSFKNTITTSEADKATLILRIALNDDKTLSKFSCIALYVGTYEPEIYAMEIGNLRLLQGSDQFAFRLGPKHRIAHVFVSGDQIGMNIHDNDQFERRIFNQTVLLSPDPETTPAGTKWCLTKLPGHEEAP